MYTKEDIVARLQNGESMDSILNEMTGVINAANEEYNAKKVEAEKKAAAEAQKKADTAKKEALAADIYNAIVAYIGFCSPSLLEEMKGDMEDIVKDLTKSLDLMIMLSEKIVQMVEEQPVKVKIPSPTFEAENTITVNVDDVFDAFFKKNHLN